MEASEPHMETGTAPDPVGEPQMEPGGQSTSEAGGGAASKEAGDQPSANDGTAGLSMPEASSSQPGMPAEPGQGSTPASPASAAANGNASPSAPASASASASAPPRGDVPSPGAPVWDTNRAVAAQASALSRYELPPPPDSDIIGHLNRYQMPNLSSLLPNYSNADSEYIFRTFNVGNYDLIKTLPTSFKAQQVQAARTQRKELAKQYLMPKPYQPLIRKDPANKLGLFSTFEYIPSRYSLADELAAKDKVEGEAKRMAIGGGVDFLPPRVQFPSRTHDMNGDGYGYDDPLSAGAPPWEPPAKDSGPGLSVRDLAATEAAAAKPAWFPPGREKVGDRPTKADAQSMMSNLRKWLVADWDECDVMIFENEEDCWVVRFPLSGVDSQEGLLAYMNVFLRANPQVNDYRLCRVGEFWGKTPGDGAMYFVVRPPWVKPNSIVAYYTLHPEQRDWTERQAALEAEASANAPPPAEVDSNAGSSSGAEVPRFLKNVCSLRYGSRLQWGTNMMTNTASSAEFSKKVSRG